MNYERRNWVDEANQYPDRYAMQSLPNGMVNLTPSPGIVDTVGTPQSAYNFNHIEYGISDNSIAFSLLALHLQIIKDTMGSTEIGTITLTNTLGFPFNNSRVTVPLTKPRLSLNYGVEVIDAVPNDGKPIGDIIASARQLNGFSLGYTGSASSVTITYRITGGIAA